jgi:hypothetical protein
LEVTAVNAHHRFRLAIGPAIAAVALSLFLVPQVAATTPTPTPFSKWGTTAVIDAATGQQNIVNGEPEVCDFYFEFDLNITTDILSWEVRDSANATVLKGSGGPTDADGKLRQPDSGSLSLPNGEYKVVFDDEAVVDSSHGIQHFRVNCTESGGGATPTPTEAPAAPTPTGVVLPGQGTPPPAGGGVQAAKGTPRVTLPPTDTGAATTGGASGLAVILAGIALLAAAITLVSGRRYSYARNRRRR